MSRAPGSDDYNGFGPSYAQVLDGTLSGDWFSESVREEWLRAGRSRDGRTPRLLQPATPQGWQHDEPLPLPPLATIYEMERESRQLPPGEFGPIGQAWFDKVLTWAQRMKLKYQQGRTRVAGSWRLNIEHWRRRLQRLPAARRKRVLDIIEFGATLPFKGGVAPTKPLRKLNNHPRLHERPDDVWRSIKEQLFEGAIDPVDVGGKVPVGGCVPQGSSDVDVLPKGVYPIRWVEKSGSDDVRITINMIPLNDTFEEGCGAVELATLSKMASLWQKNDYQVTLDQHSAYYHLEYHKDAKEWVSFMIDDSELPPEAVKLLSQRCPQARWGDSKWVFVYRGLAMGCAPSAAQYCLCVDALMDTWRHCTVGEVQGLPPEQIRCSQYIDDSIYLVQGFAHALELGLRVTLEHIICGFHVGVQKSELLPAMKRIFLGCWCDSRSLSFSLTAKRCRKLKKRLKEVRHAVRTAKRDAKGRRQIDMRTLAMLVGSIWSVQITCHRAVSMMARGMCDVLASSLRFEWIKKERNRFRLKRLLRAAWRGSAAWSAAAERELVFWESIDFARLRSPMSFDALEEDAEAFILNPTRGTIAAGVKVVCSDSSDFATGAAVFQPGSDGEWEAIETMFAPLSDVAVRESSTYKELEGILKADLTLIPLRCKYVFAVCDNRAVVFILKRGSRKPILQRLASAIFMKCLRLGRILFPVWQSREQRIVRVADLGGRVVDHYNWRLPMHLFWRANDIARSIWGRGFQFDRFSSYNTVMPADSRRKLPFNSYYLQPYCSGRCAFRQRWSRWVNWVHPPQHLVGRVISLLRKQRAVAAVVLPMGARALWSPAALPGAEGVRHLFTFNPRSPHNYMIGGNYRCTWRGSFAVCFFDFRTCRHGFVSSPSAEHLKADSDAERWTNHDQLLFCMAPGFMPGRGALSHNKFARCTFVNR